MVSQAHGIQILGAPDGGKTWVYLCGLSQDNNSLQEQENRTLLEHIGRRLNITFLAVEPTDRCEPADNQLCWIHYTPHQAEETYAKVKAAIKDYKIDGYLGFSNGGYFLNDLAQRHELGCPIISVGAAGSVVSPNISNHITIIIGQQELAYEAARQFVYQTKETPLRVQLVEHPGDHELPLQELERVLTSFY